MIVFDSTALSTVWVPGAIACSWKTKKPIRHARERVDALIERIAASGDVIVIPAPVLSEIIVKIPAKADEIVRRLRTSPWFRVEAFDTAAAVELGIRTARAIAAGDKREGSQADWSKVKFDRQILSIAIVINASQILSEDADLAALGERWGFPVTSIEELPIPAELVPPPLLADLPDASVESDPRSSEEDHPKSEDR